MKETAMQWLEHKLHSMCELKKGPDGMVICEINFETLELLFNTGKSIEKREHTEIFYNGFEMANKKIA
jgi:hypothetical protein